MRGSMSSQCGYLSSLVNEIGESKYEAKEEARDSLEAQGISATSEHIAGETGIFSASTLSNYVGRWIELGNYAREEYGLRDLAKIDGDTVNRFLEDKLERGVSYSHFSGYCAAFGKLESALEKYSNNVRGEAKEYNFKEATKDIRAEAKQELSRFEGTRAYSDTSKLVENLSGKSELVAKIQLESGARLAEASHITAGQLRGLTNDQHTGKAVGQFEFVGKGGKENIANLTPETYRLLVSHIDQHRELKHSPDTYRNNLQAAAATTSQDYNGSHGLRWNFAQSRMQELESSGMGYNEALGTVAGEMSHNRIDITEHYLVR